MQLNQYDFSISLLHLSLYILSITKQIMATDHFSVFHEFKIFQGFTSGMG